MWQRTERVSLKNCQRQTIILHLEMQKIFSDYTFRMQSLQMTPPFKETRNEVQTFQKYTFRFFVQYNKHLSVIEVEVIFMKQTFQNECICISSLNSPKNALHCIYDTILLSTKNIRKVKKFTKSKNLCKCKMKFYALHYQWPLKVSPFNLVIRQFP